MKKYIFLFLILSSTHSLVAQKLWENRNNSLTGLKLLSPDGKILIQESSKLICLSNIDGSKIWEKKIIPNVSVRFVGINCLAVISETKVELINTQNGTEINLNNKEYSKTIFQNINSLNFIWATNDDKTDLILLNQPSSYFKIISISDNPQSILKSTIEQDTAHLFLSNSYVKLDLKNKKVISYIPVKKTKNIVSNYGEEIITPKLLKLNQDEIIMHNGYLLKINKEGKMVWETELLSSMGSIAINKQNDIIFGTNNTSKKNLELFIYNSDNGTVKTNKAYPIKNFASLEVYDDKLFVLTNNSFGTGTISTYNASNLDLINEKAIKTEISSFNLLKVNNLLGYSNSVQTFFFNPSTLQHKDFILDPIGLRIPYTKVDNKLYFYYNGQVILQDEKNLSRVKLSDPNFSFKTVENDDLNMSMDDDCIILTGNQSIAKLKSTGEIVYNLYFPAPGESTGKILGKVLVAAASSYAQVESEKYSQLSSLASDKQYWNNIKDNYAFLGKTYGSDVTKRFSKTINDINFITMVTKNKENNNFEIIKINKKDGKIVGELPINDRKPDYIFDPIDSIIYYFNSNTITAYKI